MYLSHNNKEMETLTPLQKKQRAFLIEGCLHFNSENRSQTGGICSYNPAHENSEGCFLGRKIKSTTLRKALDEYSGSTDALSVFHLLPNHLQVYGKDFLYDCQRIHDFDFKWTEKGLSPEGLEEALEISLKYGLDVKEGDLIK